MVTKLLTLEALIAASAGLVLLMLSADCGSFAGMAVGFWFLAADCWCSFVDWRRGQPLICGMDAGWISCWCGSGWAYREERNFGICAGVADGGGGPTCQSSRACICLDRGRVATVLALVEIAHL